MIESLIFFHLVSVVAFVPASDGEYTLWDVTVNEDHTTFNASSGDNYFGIVCGNMFNQFTENMLALWQYEKHGRLG